MDLAERLADLQSRNVPLDEEELKAEYLRLLSEGSTSMMAAAQLGKTGTWFRRRRSESSEHFDPDFRESYEEIMEPNGSHAQALANVGITALVTEAQKGNVRAAEKLLMAYHPDFDFMRPVTSSGDVNIENLMIVMKDLPTEILQQAREALMARKQAELPVIDAA
jgi:hypothetical protein